MSKIAIVYFSGYGHTVKQAEAVHAGAASVGEATLYRIDQDGNLPDDAWEAISAADAIIYGSPTYMGGPAWQFKKFADASSKPWFCAGMEGQGRCRFHQLGIGERRQGHHHPISVDPVAAAWPDLGRHRAAASQHQGTRAAGRELDGRLGRRAGDFAVGRIGGRSTA